MAGVGSDGSPELRLDHVRANVKKLIVYVHTYVTVMSKNNSKYPRPARIQQRTPFGERDSACGPIGIWVVVSEPDFTASHHVRLVHCAIVSNSDRAKHGPVKMHGLVHRHDLCRIQLSSRYPP